MCVKLVRCVSKTACKGMCTLFNTANIIGVVKKVRNARHYTRGFAFYRVHGLVKLQFSEVEKYQKQ